MDEIEYELLINTVQVLTKSLKETSTKYKISMCYNNYINITTI